MTRDEIAERTAEFWISLGEKIIIVGVLCILVYFPPKGALAYNFVAQLAGTVMGMFVVFLGFGVAIYGFRSLHNLTDK